MPDFDPRMLQLGQLGVSMMGGGGNPLAAPRPKQWWEQGGFPGRRNSFGQQQNDPNSPTGQSAGQSANSPGQQPQSLLDMLMGAGGSTGRPSLGPIPSMGMANMPASAWSQLAGLFGGKPVWGAGGGGSPG